MPPNRLLLAFLGLAPACGSNLDLSSAGEVALTDPGETSSDSSSGEPAGDDDGIETSTGGTASGDASGDASGSESGESRCDEDPACGPDEDLETCPEQCSVCGDGVVSGDEDCDNGTNTSEPYYWYKPSSVACAPGCRTVAWCGDGEVNGPEPCDGGHEQTTTCEIDCSIPFCGDGLVNPVRGEACDDGNNEDADGCTADCAHEERFVFVSSIRVRGDFESDWQNPAMFTGLALADERCRQLADATKLEGTYKAWLSTASTSPHERFDTKFTGKYRLRAKLSNDVGPVIATGWADLTDGTLAHPIDRDENGDYADLDLAWTNTKANGTRASKDHCYNWTLAAVNESTILGATEAKDSSWSAILDDQSCAAMFRFYCFEDPDRG